MRVLVTGVDGYIGVLLAQVLLERSHCVVGLDTGFYRDGWLYDNKRMSLHGYIKKDIRAVTVQDLEGFDAVVHLAELSNDPLGQHSPEITYDINHRGSVELAKKCKKVGIQRFVYSSSCSVYGVGSDAFMTEESEATPQTAYADCKVRVERDVAQMADANFSPTFLRNATAYGASPRMRFDLVLNNLAALAWTTSAITMSSDGTPWRPLVHVLDICGAMSCVLEAPRDAIHNEIFNVGRTGENYRVREIAEIIAQVFQGCRLSVGSNGGDNRSYRVSFEKIHTCLAGFNCRWDVKRGAEELREVFERIAMSGETFGFRAFTRLNQLEHLLRTNQIDGHFFWQKVS